MKNNLKINFIIVVLGLFFNFQSCKFLDIDPYITDLFTIDSLFSRKEYTEKYLNNIYSYLTDNGSNRATDFNNSPYSIITDEAVAAYDPSKTHNYNRYLNNLVTPESIGSSFDIWNFSYEGIRKANTFLIRVNDCKEVSELKRLEWIGEASFLKALIYFELMLRWGPVPIMPDKPIDFDTPINEMMVERNTWDECNDYVASLLETAIKLLPEYLQSDFDIGRPTKHSAMAVLSRLTLYTASLLFNGENKEFELSFRNKEGKPYLNPNKNIEKWAIAAVNAKRLVDLKPNDLYTVPKMSNTPNFPVPDHEQGDFPNGVGGIDPYHSYHDMFNGECFAPSSNKEILFSRQRTDLRFSLQYHAPWVVGGWGCFFIPQNLVDAYYMADGRTIHDSSDEYPYEAGYTDNDIVFSGNKTDNGFTILSGTHKMYVNREMRFYATIAYNNSYYPSISTPADKIDGLDGKVAKYYFDSKSGKDFATWKVNREEYPMTGYLCKKYIHYEDSWLVGGRLKNKYNIVYRMAEVYLNYVEAMNELDKSYTIDGITVSRDLNEMKRCFNLIRYRAGLPGITDADVADVSKMRELILRERQIEMVWENRRYFDLRRTKQAIKYENAVIEGCNVNVSNAEPDKFHTIVRVTERDWIYRIFTSRQTFFPIPKSEIEKNHNLTQFPGY